MRRAVLPLVDSPHAEQADRSAPITIELVAITRVRSRGPGNRSNGRETADSRWDTV